MYRLISLKQIVNPVCKVSFRVQPVVMCRVCDVRMCVSVNILSIDAASHTQTCVVNNIKQVYWCNFTHTFIWVHLFLVNILVCQFFFFFFTKQLEPCCQQVAILTTHDFLAVLLYCKYLCNINNKCMANLKMQHRFVMPCISNRPEGNSIFSSGHV